MDVSIKVTKQQNLKQRPRKKGKLQLKSAKIKKNKKKHSKKNLDFTRKIQTPYLKKLQFILYTQAKNHNIPLQFSSIQAKLKITAKTVWAI